MSFLTLLQYIGYGVVFVVMISVLVAAHELGHYLFARMFNMGVEEFAIGFGKRRLVTWMRRSYVLPIRPGEDLIDGSHASPGAVADSISSTVASLEGSSPDRRIEPIETPEGPALREETDFTVRPWPLGGFVRIKGMLPEEDGSETRIVGGFYSKPPWQRFLVLFAGPLFSILAGILILIPVYMVDGEVRLSQEPVIDALSTDGAAQAAGMKIGDRIVAVDGKPISSFFEVVSSVREHPGQPIPMQVQRAGKSLSLTVTPKPDTDPTPVLAADLTPTSELKKQGKMGAQPKQISVRLSFPGAIAKAVDMPIQAVRGVVQMFAKPSTFKESVGGPQTMVTATAGAVNQGIWKVLGLSAMLSISVGIFNLLPAAPLDGGQMLMALVEMFRRGRRLSIRAQSIANGIGLTIVATLVVSALVVDFQRFDVPKPKDAPGKAPSR